MNKIVNALYSINIGAKDCFFVAEQLESYLEKGWFQDFCIDEQKVMSEYSDAVGVSIQFNNDCIIFSCQSETECLECMISGAQRDCPLFKELSTPSMVLSKNEDIKEGIK